MKPGQNLNYIYMGENTQLLRQNIEKFTNIIRKAKNQKVFIPNIFLELIINCITFLISYIRQTVVVVFDEAQTNIT